MDIRRMNKEEKLNILRKYFFIGMAGLPLAWIINCIWFYDETFSIENEPTELYDIEVRNYVIKSGLGLMLYISIFSIWIFVFMMYRIQWGEFGDTISFTIQKGTL